MPILARVGRRSWKMRLAIALIYAMLTLGQNTRRFRAAARAQYGTVETYSEAAGIRYPAWSYVGPPVAYFAERRFTFPDTAAFRLYYRVKEQAPLADRVVVDLDGQFW